ncbi:protein adenylyltransferase SelO [Flavobacterium stagni]|uniref:Protein nucleotidyltransferase YdiU n=1 Tax=Flavobacterium stagni TaxID=2506421 RepID=A0A4Q1K7M1_9FLAO|nr:YdiU family protein [Flavobacterium stagni]RXR21641.1 YdiU family protein [Flavobacterium stagni]
MKKLHFIPRFQQALTPDPETANFVRQVPLADYSYVTPRIPSKPYLIHAVAEVAESIGLEQEDIKSTDFLHYFSGKEVYPDTRPFAMNYAGHQFGNWAGQLGDGRAIVLGEVEHHNQLWTLQLKGAGKTPYSRRGDGLAVLRSSIREYLCAEAMHHLGVPTSRSLSLIGTGDEVLRDMLYDGNADYEKGAVVCRVAPTFLRFGSFEVHAARQEQEQLQQLADFVIREYHPEITSDGPEKYTAFFKAVCEKTLQLMVEWQRVGFVHGVMNTDNMSVHGITIDYGPYGWLEDYNLNWTPNTTDSQHHRYAYGNQPDVALWNLIQLANALYPLIGAAEPLEAVLNAYGRQFDAAFLQMNRDKLGLATVHESDEKVVRAFLTCLEKIETDYTIFFRLLATVQKTDSPEAALARVNDAFYTPSQCAGDVATAWLDTFQSYLDRLELEPQSDAERAAAMNQVNPKYVLRNYMAQLAIDAANQDDFSLIHELHELLKKPYDEQPEHEKWFSKRPDWARTKVGCSMLSCSS